MVDGWKGLTRQPPLPLLSASLWSRLKAPTRQGACSQQCRIKEPFKLLCSLIVRATAPVSPLNLVFGASPEHPLNRVPPASPICPLPSATPPDAPSPFPGRCQLAFWNLFIGHSISSCPHSVSLFVSSLPFHPCLASSPTQYILILPFYMCSNPRPAVCATAWSLYASFQSDAACHRDICVLCVDGQAQSDHIRLPMRPFFPPETEAYFHSITSTSWCQWARDYPRQQTFALVSPRESKFHSPGHHYPDNNTTVLLLDGQAQYGEPRHSYLSWPSWLQLLLCHHKPGQCISRVLAFIAVQAWGVTILHHQNCL